MKVKVQINKVGHYDHKRRRSGDVFSIPDEPRRALSSTEQKQKFKDDPIYAAVFDKKGLVPQAFSFVWMIPVSEETMEQITTPQQHVDAMAPTRKSTGDREVI